MDTLQILQRSCFLLNSLFCFVLFLLFVRRVYCTPFKFSKTSDFIEVGTGLQAYETINIEIDEVNMIPQEQCQAILLAIEDTLVAASKLAYVALETRYFKEFNIILPQSWDDICIPVTDMNETIRHSHFMSQQAAVSMGGHSDIIVTNLRSPNGDEMWTSQFGACGMPGLNIFIHCESLNQKYSAKLFLKEWVKYRYGVFDEIGIHKDPIYPACYNIDGQQCITGCSDHEVKGHDVKKFCERENNFVHHRMPWNPLAKTSLMTSPQADNVSLFCNRFTHNRYAPTKHNYLCDRLSILDVILKHNDFEGHIGKAKHKIMIPKPNFNYKRRSLSRYVVVIDDSTDMSVRESWSFLRSVFRKWVLYDLLDNTEVGVILLSGQNVSKSLKITPLEKGSNRDLVASFLPYTSTNVHNTICVRCAIQKSLEMFDDRRVLKGTAANIILIIAAGIERTILDTTQLRKKINTCINRPRLVTINYPTVTLKTRQPLDVLSNGDLSFSIYEEKYNSEKSYMDSYVQLANVLMHISRYLFERTRTTGLYPPLELHRRVIRDSIEQRIRGEFFLDEGISQPAGFYIYTHSTEIPLIQSMRLISPSGTVFQSLSDQRIPVKQLTIMSPLNESGIWTYEIERYPGNPQPHIIQVIGTPMDDTTLPVMVNSWVIVDKESSCFMMYTKVSQGYDPLHHASIEVVIERYNLDNNSIGIRLTLELYDDGMGDIDIVSNDGIYSRKFRFFDIGRYTFEFFTKSRFDKSPFYRYSPLFTKFITQHNIDNIRNKPLTPVRTLNFKCEKTSEALNFTWHFNDPAICGYELRYAYSLQTIVDQYEEAQILIERDISIQNSYKNFSYLHDILTTPIFNGKTIFFALRPKFRHRQIRQIISNVIDLYINEPVIATTTLSNLLFYDITQPLDLNETNINQTNSVVTRVDFGSSIEMTYFVLSLSGLVLLIVLIMICIVYLIKKCKSKIEKKTQSELKSRTKVTCYSEDPLQSVPGVNLQYTGNEYSILEVNLQEQNIGIPIYKNEIQRSIYDLQTLPDENIGISPSSYDFINSISTCDDGPNNCLSPTTPTCQLENKNYLYLGSLSEHIQMGISEEVVPPVPPLPYPLLNTAELQYFYFNHRSQSDTTCRDHSDHIIPCYLPSQTYQYFSSKIDPATNVSHTQNLLLDTSQKEATAEMRKCRNVTMV